MGRLWRLIKGWFLRLIGKAEAASPRALLEAEIADFNKATAQFNENLAKQAGLIERLKRQIADAEKKERILQERARAAYTAKQMDKAGHFALLLKETRQQLEENRMQLQAAEQLYQNLRRQRDVFVRDARARIDRIKQKLSQAEMAEAQAKLAEMASSVQFDAEGKGLAELEEKLEERISDARGKVRVATEGAEASPWSVTAEEQSALEQAALADLAAELGLEPPPTVADQAPETATPELGPVATESATESDASGGPPSTP